MMGRVGLLCVMAALAAAPAVRAGESGEVCRIGPQQISDTDNLSMVIDPPAALRRALVRDIGDYADAGESFDAEEGKGLLWIFRRDDRWVVGVWQGGDVPSGLVLTYRPSREGMARLTGRSEARLHEVCRATMRQLG